MLIKKMLIFVFGLLLISTNTFAQIKISISPDSIINQMAAGFGTNTYAMLDSVPVTYDEKKTVTVVGVAWDGLYHAHFRA